jgi:hypothetical protein
MTGITDLTGMRREPHAGRGLDQTRSRQVGRNGRRMIVRGDDPSTEGSTKSRASYGSAQLKGIKQDRQAWKSLACSEIANVPECTGCATRRIAALRKESSRQRTFSRSLVNH